MLTRFIDWCSHHQPGFRHFCRVFSLVHLCVCNLFFNSSIINAVLYEFQVYNIVIQQFCTLLSAHPSVSVFKISFLLKYHTHSEKRIDPAWTAWWIFPKWTQPCNHHLRQEVEHYCQLRLGCLPLHFLCVTPILTLTSQIPFACCGTSLSGCLQYIFVLSWFFIPHHVCEIHLCCVCGSSLFSLLYSKSLSENLSHCRYELLGFWWPWILLQWAFSYMLLGVPV